MLSTPILVLVVDDAPDTLSLINDVLEAEGMVTLVALEGCQALRIAHKMRPDIVLLDALMPSLDGFETCREMKRSPELSTIPVIFMTGLSDTQSIVNAFEAGGVDYITKPVNPIELIARVKVHLANARITRSAQTALDSAGQNICAVNSQGVLLWSTPQVTRILEKSGIADWSKATLQTTLRDWLQHGPTDGARCIVKTPAGSLSFVCLGQSNAQEILLRIINDEQPDEVALLRAQYQLTQREAEVLVWVAKGKTNREIAQILDLSPRTVNKHLEQVFKKVGVENRTSAASRAAGTLQKCRGY